MDRQLIKTLIDALQSSGLSELEYASGGETLRLVKNGGTPLAPRAAAPPTATALPAEPPPAPAPATSAGVVSAPLYGVVHLQAAPGASPYVAVGDAVEAGAVVCTLEAMKVFTEVRTARGGTVEAVLVADGQEVELGQALMRLA